MSSSAEIDNCFPIINKSSTTTLKKDKNLTSIKTTRKTSSSCTSCLAISVNSSSTTSETHNNQVQNLVGLINLPREVWTQILSFVPQYDRLQHRLVNKAWRNLIDKCSTFKVTYNDVPPHLLAHVLGLRIRGCEFSGIREIPPQPFSHPLLIREITLGAGMSPKYTKEILSCCKNVETLRYFVTEKSDTAFDPICGGGVGGVQQHDEYLKNLRKLKTIEIGILFFGRSRNSTSISTCVKTLLGNTSIIYSGLVEIQIHFELTKSEWDILYAFIRRNSETLCKFGVYRQCICEYDDDQQFISAEVAAAAADNDNNSSTVSVQDRLLAFKACKWKSVTVVRGASYKCRCSGELLWSHFLNDQFQLESLTTDLVPNRGVIDNFISKNRNTLSKLNLQDVSLGVDAHMDFSIFQQCTKLQFLSLHFLSCAVIIMTMKKNHGGGRPSSSSWAADDNNKDDDEEEGEDEDNKSNNKPYTERFSECSGLQFLPKSLKYLSIKGCDSFSSTLLEMSQALTNLTELVLGAPSGPLIKRLGYGVTINVFLGFLQNMSKLTRLTIHRNFLNLSIEEEKMLLSLLKDITSTFKSTTGSSSTTSDIIIINDDDDNDQQMNSETVTDTEFLKLHFVTESFRQSVIERINFEFKLC